MKAFFWAGRYEKGAAEQGDDQKDSEKKLFSTDLFVSPEQSKGQASAKEGNDCREQDAGRAEVFGNRAGNAEGGVNTEEVSERQGYAESGRYVSLTHNKRIRNSPKNNVSFFFRCGTVEADLRVCPA